MSTAVENSTPKTAIQLPEIIARYAAGESVQALAADIKVHRATLYRWMLAGKGDADYHDLVTDVLVNRIADADERLQDSADACDIARAREMARFARMDFERRRPKLYGAKDQDGPTGITIVIADGLAKTVSVAQQTHGNASDLDSVQQQKCLITTQDTQSHD